MPTSREPCYRRTAPTSGPDNETAQNDAANGPLSHEGTGTDVQAAMLEKLDEMAGNMEVFRGSLRAGSVPSEALRTLIRNIGELASLMPETETTATSESARGKKGGTSQDAPEESHRPREWDNSYVHRLRTVADDALTPARAFADLLMDLDTPGSSLPEVNPVRVGCILENLLKHAKSQIDAADSALEEHVGSVLFIRATAQNHTAAMGAFLDVEVEPMEAAHA